MMLQVKKEEDFTVYQMVQGIRDTHSTKNIIQNLTIYTVIGFPLMIVSSALNSCIGKFKVNLLNFGKGWTSIQLLSV